tara:strand:- start:1650 stop:2189 length:540 start_codon:yes stop_codon:yes gene_type:complete
MFQGFSINKYKYYKLPEPGSIKELSAIMEVSATPLNIDFANLYDNISGTFERIFYKRNIVAPTNLINSLIQGAKPTIKNIKKYHNRKRPHQAALDFGVTFIYHNMESAKTPSFPSGHAAQSQLVAQVLSDIYPRLTTEFMKAAKNIGHSRVVGRVHYKYDIEIGEKLGNDLYSHYLNNA